MHQQDQWCHIHSRSWIKLSLQRWAHPKIKTHVYLLPSLSTSHHFHHHHHQYHSGRYFHVYNYDGWWYPNLRHSYAMINHMRLSTTTYCGHLLKSENAKCQPVYYWDYEEFIWMSAVTVCYHTGIYGTYNSLFRYNFLVVILKAIFCYQCKLIVYFGLSTKLYCSSLMLKGVLPLLWFD